MIVYINFLMKKCVNFDEIKNSLFVIRYLTFCINICYNYISIIHREPRNITTVFHQEILSWEKVRN
jgi:hypothetical protein